MSLLRQDFVFDQRRRHHAVVVPCVEEIAQPEWPALLVERVRIIGHDMIELQFADDIAGAVARLAQIKQLLERGQFVVRVGPAARRPFGMEMAGLLERPVVRLDIQRGEAPRRSEEHTSELQSLMRISYAVFCLKKKTT